MAKPKAKVTRPIAVWYYPTGRSWGKPIETGCTTSLVNARGRVAMHIAREDYFPRAVIIDRYTGRWLVKMWRQVDGSIHIKENEE